MRTPNLGSARRLLVPLFLLLAVAMADTPLAQDFEPPFSDPNLAEMTEAADRAADPTERARWLAALAAARTANETAYRAFQARRAAEATPPPAAEAWAHAVALNLELQERISEAAAARLAAGRPPVAEESSDYDGTMSESWLRYWCCRSETAMNEAAAERWYDVFATGWRINTYSHRMEEAARAMHWTAAQRWGLVISETQQHLVALAEEATALEGGVGECPLPSEQRPMCAPPPPESIEEPLAEVDPLLEEVDAFIEESEELLERLRGEFGPPCFTEREADPPSGCTVSGSSNGAHTDCTVTWVDFRGNSRLDDEGLPVAPAEWNSENRGVSSWRLSREQLRANHAFRQLLEARDFEYFSVPELETLFDQVPDGIDASAWSTRLHLEIVRVRFRGTGDIAGAAEALLRLQERGIIEPFVWTNEEDDFQTEDELLFLRRINCTGFVQYAAWLAGNQEPAFRIELGEACETQVRRDPLMSRIDAIERPGYRQGIGRALRGMLVFMAWPGGELANNRAGYRHVGIYVGDGYVIHLYGDGLRREPIGHAMPSSVLIGGTVPTHINTARWVGLYQWGRDHPDPEVAEVRSLDECIEDARMEADSE